MKEKTLQDVHAGIREFYNRAVEFERKENWEFAIGCMLEAVTRVPAFTVARNKLRFYEKQHTRNLKGFALTLAQLKTMLPLMKVKKMIGRDPIEAMSECEKLLAGNLNNPPVLQTLAEAAGKADAADIAVEALQILHDYQPGNVAVLRKLAGLHREIGHPQEALKVYQYLAGKYPKDRRIQAELREAATFASQKKAEWDRSSLSSRGKSVKDDALTIQLAEGTLRDADHARKLIDIYKSELAENNSDETRKKLAEAYSVCGEFDKAIAQLETVANNLPALDPTLDKLIERTYLAKYKVIVDELRKKVKSDPALAGNLGEAEKFLLDFRVERAEERSRAYPAEASLHFELGAVYYEAKRYEEAITELLESVKSPNRRTQSLALLGRCELARNRFPEAVKYCEEALTEMVRMDRNKFEIMYARAEALERLSKVSEALAAFQEIYRNDSRFKDVADRIRALGGEL